MLREAGKIREKLSCCSLPDSPSHIYMVDTVPLIVTVNASNYQAWRDSSGLVLSGTNWAERVSALE